MQLKSCVAHLTHACVPVTAICLIPQSSAARAQAMKAAGCDSEDEEELGPQPHGPEVGCKADILDLAYPHVVSTNVRLLACSITRACMCMILHDCPRKPTMRAIQS